MIIMTENADGSLLLYVSGHLYQMRTLEQTYVLGFCLFLAFFLSCFVVVMFFFSKS